MDAGDRPLQDEERRLVAYVWDMEASKKALSPAVRVTEMADGGMGSLSFASSKAHRSFGKVAGECSFADADGVSVEAALLLDKDGDLFELDLWKVDFSPLIRIPDPVTFSPRHGTPNGS